MCGNLISHPTEQFSKLLFVRKKSSSVDLVRRVKIVIPILKNCFVSCERFESRILCFELNAIEKYNVSKKVFEAIRYGSYFHLVAVLLEKKITKERCKDENRKLCIYSCRYLYKLEENNAYVFVINGHGLHTTETKGQKSADKKIFERHVQL